MSANIETKLPPIVRSVRVPCSPEKAFAFFTAEISKWWPLASHSVAASKQTDDTAESCVMEPKPGGRIFERTRSGSEHLWGTIVKWEPPTKLEYNWHPGRSAATAQMISVTFEPVEGATEVTIRHTDWEKLGEKAEETWRNYSGGWDAVLLEFQAPLAAK